MSPDVRADVAFRASVSPSEDPLKVVRAVSYLTGGGEPELLRGETVRFRGEGTSSLVFIRDQLRDKRIRAAARRLLLRGTEGRRTTLMLNRQAAAAGVVALCSEPEESPLGPVYLTLTSDRLQELVDWLAEAAPG